MKPNDPNYTKPSRQSYFCKQRAGILTSLLIFLEMVLVSGSVQSSVNAIYFKHIQANVQHLLECASDAWCIYSIRADLFSPCLWKLLNLRKNYKKPFPLEL